MTSARPSSPRSSRPACTAATRPSSRSRSWSRLAAARSPLLLGGADAALLVADLWAAAAGGRRVAVLDPSWPKALRTQAEGALARAVGAGRVRPGDLVLFTSGSSGRPRGVVRTAASWHSSVEPLSEITGIGPDDVVWLPGSATSTLTLYGGWHATAVGARVVGAAGWPQSAPPREITALHAAPRVLAAAVAAAERGELPAVRVAVVAGDSLPPDVRSRVNALGWRLVEYYGAAELSFVAWRPDSSAYQRFPGVEIEVRGGHIWVQSDYVCTGYLDPDDAGPLHRDGAWATVGDLGRLTADGLDVLGRGDAAVTTGGRTVVVEEVESVLRSSPGLRGQIDDVVVSSIPHPLLGQLLVALVAVDPERPALTRADLDRAAAALPDWSVPRRWWLVDGLPRTPVGKVDRSAVRAGIADGSLTPRPLR